MRASCPWTEKDKYHMISLTCGILTNKNKLIDTKNKLVVARGGGWKLDKIDEVGQAV